MKVLFTLGSRRRDRGVAMLVVITWLALMIALVGEFTFGTTVDTAEAANARDELRAHYMARSAVNLSRLLIKIQTKFVDPVMAQAQKMLKDFMGGSGGQSGSSANPAAPAGGLGISLRVTDYADMLMGFFSGSKDEANSLGSLIGLDLTNAKGLGLTSGRFDAEITAEDGKIDLNCGGGLGTQGYFDKQKTVFRLLSGLMYAQRYDRLFNSADTGGQFNSRLEVARALIDFVDADQQMFAFESSSTSAAEDYHYDADPRDKYRAHNNTLDSLEEIRLVRGVSDGFYEAFSPYLTVYPNSDTNKACKVNMGVISNKEGDCAPLVMGIIRAAAMGDPTKAATLDPTILDDTKLYPLATVLCDRASAGGFDSLDTVEAVLTKPESAVLTDDPRYRVLSGMQPLSIKKDALGQVAYVAPPRTYRIVATGESGKVKKKITAIIDTVRTIENPLTVNVASEQAAGALQYWREE